MFLVVVMGGPLPTRITSGGAGSSYGVAAVAAGRQRGQDGITCVPSTLACRKAMLRPGRPQPRGHDQHNRMNGRASGSLQAQVAAVAGDHG